MARRAPAGSRIALIAAPSLEAVIGVLGIARAGMIAVPIPPPAGRSATARLASVMADCAPALVLTTEPTPTEALPEVPVLTAEAALAEGAASTPPPLGPDDVAFIQYTSGSTAEPKGVVITHGNVAAAQQAIADAFGTNAADTMVSWLPVEHDMGLIFGALHGLWCGIHTVLMPPAAFARRPRTWLEAISDYRATISGGPNFAYDLCVDTIGLAQRDGLSLASWRVAFNGAEPVRPETIERFSAAFAPCGFEAQSHYPCYGLAEATLLVSGGDRGRPPRIIDADPAALAAGRLAAPGPGRCQPLASCGCVRPSGSGLIVDPVTLMAQPDGTVGEIWLAGESVARGYFGRPEETASTFLARTADGAGPFLRTGDLGLIDAGELFVTGRIKDLIIVAGRNIHPYDLESTAGTVACCRPGRGVAHQAGNGGVVLIQELRGEAADSSAVARAIWRAVLRDHRLALEAVFLVRPGSLLWTTSRKVRRRATFERIAADQERVIHRELFAARAGSVAAVQRHAMLLLQASGPRADAIGAFLQTWLDAELHLAPDVLDLDAPFADLGLTSLAAVEFTADLEAATGLALEDTLLFDYPTARSLAGEIGARLCR